MGVDLTEIEDYKWDIYIPSCTVAWKTDTVVPLP